MKKKKEFDWDLFAWFAVFTVGLIFWFKVVPSIKDTVFNSDAKEYCSTSHKVTSAKTDYAAKKAYKACLKNY